MGARLLVSIASNGGAQKCSRTSRQLSLKTRKALLGPHKGLVSGDSV